jgi:hypothetical protein
VSQPDQGRTFAAFIERELEVERERRRSLDARGAAVVTTSGSLTTLLAAVGAFVGGRPGFHLLPGSVGPLTLTLLAFASAAVCGIVVTGLPWYEVAAPDQLRTMLAEKWRTDEVDARNYTAELDVDTIESLRKGNKTKAEWLVRALVAQVVGLFSLTLTVYLIVNAAS